MNCEEWLNRINIEPECAWNFAQTKLKHYGKSTEKYFRLAGSDEGYDIILKISYGKMSLAVYYSDSTVIESYEFDTEEECERIAKSMYRDYIFDDDRKESELEDAEIEESFHVFVESVIGTKALKILSQYTQYDDLLDEVKARIYEVTEECMDDFGEGLEPA